ncbi:dipeptidase PepV [Gemella haemolysans]|uniref:Dipeptidase PepV n=1 Tax=Gemella haemolysans ATCC 10379 TaxID=546270 RepID=C5NWZ8_9BACL|nr:dipeptidase PepV [Gemella haemolysans]EER68333.1 dipeptidase PepV [Gemella haemolysans ATCC 10379]KAA8707448.1 dipeptidase PepV [Gemella haemolysans]UBH81694.1 dipeptidase PepV [Gemella haemolysans]VEI38399.1 Putative dipeptidase SA1572 [Gemella haemolysans]
MSIDFKKEVLNHKEDLLKDLFELLSVRSILGTDITEETPFGSGPREALDLILSFGERDGYKTKLVENKAGHIEVGQGEELFGILGHVDVVPVVEADWTSHPFKPEIRDGKIFARGSLDDKGPTMAAYYAVKLLDKLGVKWNKRVRVIIGSDEETGFRCVEAYFKHEEQPASGFTPDAMFPLVYAEKARATFDHKLKFVVEDGNYNYKLVKFNGGQVLNMVIASAKAELVGEVSDIKEKFENFLVLEKLDGEVTVEDTIKLTLKGKAAHGSTPQYGVNGATKLAEFLSTLGLDNNGKNFVDYIVEKLANDPFGEKLGIDYSDNEMGEATYNYGIIDYDLLKKVGIVSTDCRHPMKFDLVARLNGVKVDNIDIEVTSTKEAHYVPKDDELVTTLMDVYRKHTGDTKNDAFVLGGGTYARCLKKGVAFGLLFPDKEDTMHQANEYLEVEDLLLATAIYAEGIYKLCCE